MKLSERINKIRRLHDGSDIAREAHQCSKEVAKLEAEIVQWRRVAQERKVYLQQAQEKTDKEADWRIYWTGKYEDIKAERDALVQFLRDYFPAHKLGSCYLGLSYFTGPKECVCGLTKAYQELPEATRKEIG